MPIKSSPLKLREENLYFVMLFSFLENKYGAWLSLASFVLITVFLVLKETDEKVLLFSVQREKFESLRTIFPAMFKEKRKGKEDKVERGKGFMNLNDKIFENNLLQETMRAGPEMKCFKLCPSKFKRIEIVP